MENKKIHKYFSFNCRKKLPKNLSPWQNWKILWNKLFKIWTSIQHSHYIITFCHLEFFFSCAEIFFLVFERIFRCCFCEVRSGCSSLRKLKWRHCPIGVFYRSFVTDALPSSTIIVKIYLVFFSIFMILPSIYSDWKFYVPNGNILNK